MWVLGFTQQKQLVNSVAWLLDFIGSQAPPPFLFQCFLLFYFYVWCKFEAIIALSLCLYPQTNTRTTFVSRLLLPHRLLPSNKF